MRKQQPERSKTYDVPQRANILSIDYGRSRIGLAIADTEARLAQPLLTMERVNRNEDMRRLRELARERGVEKIIIGLPLRLDGTRGEMAEEVTRFADRVRKQIGLPVEMVDERLTSWEAERLLEEFGGRMIRAATPVQAAGREPRRLDVSRKADEGKMTVDAFAAAVILKDYLEHHRPDAVGI